jgi:hypothetical protein
MSYRSHNFVPWAIVLSCLICATVHAKPIEFSGGFPITRRAEVYPLETLKVGAKGTGYTVFQGAKAEPFGVEILGIMKGMLGPGRDVILARLSGERIEFTGVISGMSGSPVYIDGKLLGAVSYRFGRFSKEPIAGITPIDSMLDVFSKSVPPRLESRAKPRSKGIDIRDLRTRTPQPPPMARIQKTRNGTEDLRPIDTPIILGGFPPHIHVKLKEELARAGMITSFGAVTGKQRGKASPRKTGRLDPNVASMAAGVHAAPIAPASPISAVLMQGDMSMSAVGTVTYVEDGRVLGFGHPFFGEGHVQFPMATSAILNTLASDSGSYKQASPGLEVGTITHDRLTAIAGNFTEIAPMLPLRVRVYQTRNFAVNDYEQLEVEIVKHQQWTPTLARIGVDSAIGNRLGFELGGTIDVLMNFQVGDRTLTIKDAYAGPAPTSVGSLIAADVGSVAMIIANNAFESADIQAIDVKVAVSNTVQVSWIEALVPSKKVARPGDTVNVVAILRDYRGKEHRLNLPIRIPKSARKSVTLLVGGSVELDRRDADARNGLVPSSLDQLLGILAERRDGRGLYARTYMKSVGLRSQTELMSSLPVSQRTILGGDTRASRVATDEVMGEAVHVKWNNIVVGELPLTIRISD